MEGEPLNNVIVPGKMTRGVRHIDVSFWHSYWAICLSGLCIWAFLF